MNKKSILLTILSCNLLFSFFTASHGAKFHAQFKKMKKKPFRSYHSFVTKPECFLVAIQSALDYMKEYTYKGRPKRSRRKILHGGKVFDKRDNVSLKRVRDTLKFLKATIEKDRMQIRKGLRTGYRINDQKFLHKHFDIIDWQSSSKDAKKYKDKVEDGAERLTKYLVYELPGKYRKKGKYKYPLYAMPEDEEGMSEKEVNKNKHKLIRFKYSKQEIINEGALENNPLVEPLVWLTKEGVRQASIQGSIIAIMPDGKRRAFNIIRSNEMVYDRSFKNEKKQRQYWFFKEIKNGIRDGRCKGKTCAVCSHMQVPHKVAYVPEVTVAGDLKNLGLGKIVALRYKNKRSKKDEVRLCMLSDTGGAFKNNLYQLDLFSGFFNKSRTFWNYVHKYPEQVDAYFLLKK